MANSSFAFWKLSGIFFLDYIFFKIWPHHWACAILDPQPGIIPMPPHWKGGVLTTMPPGKSPKYFWQCSWLNSWMWNP